MFYHFFIDGIPHYLARHYWWAYLWKPAIWFFDHQMIINAILFGQYKKLMNTTLDRIANSDHDNILQLTCVYGQLSEKLAKLVSPHRLHLTDVSVNQLQLARRKMQAIQTPLATRMNAEKLGYRDNSFNTVVLFFLLHEMPAEARRNTLSECMRILSIDGSLMLTEYGPCPNKHWLYRNRFTRRVLCKLEPFLDGFWNEDLTRILDTQGKKFQKQVEVVSNTNIFSGFYRVTEYKICNSK